MSKPMAVAAATPLNNVLSTQAVASPTWHCSWYTLGTPAAGGSFWACWKTTYPGGRAADAGCRHSGGALLRILVIISLSDSFSLFLPIALRVKNVFHHSLFDHTLRQGLNSLPMPSNNSDLDSDSDDGIEHGEHDAARARRGAAARQRQPRKLEDVERTFQRKLAKQEAEFGGLQREEGELRIKERQNSAQIEEEVDKVEDPSGSSDLRSSDLWSGHQEVLDLWISPYDLVKRHH
ncbi:hypothetical protein C8J57DRAFT_1245550 [Mycena rebaudengoi]|nr:hypothetical protein C8J57DRAFT_1245550 [Mycena rebaudengoi]